MQVARQIGSKKVARLAREMGIRTPVSRNLSIALGGLHQGVTPLDMAHAYLTFANGGKFVYGTMSPGELRGIRRPGPVGHRADQPQGRADHAADGREGRQQGAREANHRSRRSPRPSPPCCRRWSSSGTGTRAAVPDTFVAGKTGTTENYGDAWFVGWTSRYTVAIWVGYPDKLRPMKTEYAGQPVAGGTFPAAIFRSFIQNAFAAYPKKEKEKKKDEKATGAVTPTPGTPGQQAPTTPNPAPSTQAPAGGTGGGGKGGGDGGNGGTAVTRAARSRRPRPPPSSRPRSSSPRPPRPHRRPAPPRRLRGRGRAARGHAGRAARRHVTPEGA